MAAVNMLGVLKNSPQSGLIYEAIYNTYISPLYIGKTLNTLIHNRIIEELDVLRTRKKKSGATKNGDSGKNQSDQNIPAQPRSREPVLKKPVQPHRPLPSPPIQPSVKRDSHLEQQYAEIQEELAHSKEKNRRLRHNVEDLQEALRNAQDNAEDLRRRLSKIAGDKLKSNNPNIADLSDPYRPTNLGKAFSELYDNEWSDAFEEMDRKFKNENKSLTALYETVKSCKNKTKVQEEKIKDVLLDIEDSEESASIEEFKTGNENFHNALVDVRKRIIPTSSVNVSKNYVKSEFSQFIGALGIDEPGEKLVNYAMKCAELCWCMHMCDPPMDMSSSEEAGQKFDKNEYKEYTRSVKDLKQPEVEFFVWPALYLNAGGHMVSRGVAQPRDREAKRK